MHSKLKKEITFVCCNSNIADSIMEEAKLRGYVVKRTNNPFEKCNIGVYRDHVNFPQYSKFSLIMLHDILQQSDKWPDLWYWEPWNKYDIGILPTAQWQANWDKSSQYYWARPRRGVFLAGWPKADSMIQLKNAEYKVRFCKEHGIDASMPTVLYAPSWENDGKQDDFVKAMKKLQVNILIKQANWPDSFPEIQKNIKEMAEKHKGISNVTILPPSLNIFNAIAVSDILVSDESSTMFEAAMMGVPAISVTDWVIPDTNPPRLCECEFDFVTKIQKSNLAECVRNMIDHYDDFKGRIKNYAEENCFNIGFSSKMIMDIVDDCVEGKTIRHQSLQPCTNLVPSPKKWLKHCYICVRREIYNNYCERFPLVKQVWSILAKIKNAL